MVLQASLQEGSLYIGERTLHSGPLHWWLSLKRLKSMLRSGTLLWAGVLHRSTSVVATRALLWMGILLWFCRRRCSPRTAVCGCFGIGLQTSLQPGHCGGWVCPYMSATHASYPDTAQIRELGTSICQPCFCCFFFNDGKVFYTCL